MQTQSNRAGAFDFSALANRLPQQRKKSSFKEGTLHAYAELGDLKGLERLVARGQEEGRPSGDHCVFGCICSWSHAVPV
eukprot:1160534-Pelagomonas_calceolata.AAC.34